MIYRPCKAEKYGAFAMVVSSAICFTVAGCYLFPFSFEFFIPFVMGILSLIIMKYCYDASMIIVFLESDGILVINDRKHAQKFVPWSDFSYVYSIQNYKAYEHFLLSPHELNEAERKKIKRQINNSTTIIGDDYILVPCNFHKDRDQILSVLKEKQNLHFEIK